MRFREYVNTTKSNITTATGAITLDNEDEVVNCSGTFTVTLPAVVDYTNKRYYIKNIGTGAITVDGNASETIDDQTTQTLNQYDCLHIQSSGTEWKVL
ncbi:MAG: hypothetical protein KAS32_18130 [Candidatus Peribacteraceae bacterium]|nr:hypothetical protein [Candidatus Peribacteraceae bacterium]